MIDTLPSADFDDLPIIVKFLLQTVSALEAAEVKMQKANSLLINTIFQQLFYL